MTHKQLAGAKDSTTASQTDMNPNNKIFMFFIKFIICDYDSHCIKSMSEEKKIFTYHPT